MFPDISEESRWTSGCVCFDGNPFDTESFFISLNECIDNIRKSRRHIDLIESFSRISAKPTHRVRNPSSCDEAHDFVTNSLHEAFKWRKVFIESRSTITDNHLCFSFEDRAHELSDFIARVLIISISIDDDVSSEHETLHDTMMKRYTETAICFELYDMMNSEFFRHLIGIIGTPVIDNEILDGIDTIDMLR